MNWHEKAGANVLLRLAGVALLALAWAVGEALHRRALAGPVNGDVLAYLLAALTFVCATAGAALAVMGSHIFDQIEIAARWGRPEINPLPLDPPRPPSPARASPPSPAAPAPAPPEHGAVYWARGEATGRAAASSGGRP
jgi:hypothetical protein